MQMIGYGGIIPKYLLLIIRWLIPCHTSFIIILYLSSYIILIIMSSGVLKYKLFKNSEISFILIAP